MVQRRLYSPESAPANSKPADLPVDFLKMVEEVLTAHFTAGLKLLSKELKNPRFKASGQIYTDEIMVVASVLSEDRMSATTVFASIDFDSKASHPTVHDLLSACVDSIGGVFSALFEGEKQKPGEVLLSESLRDVDGVPFEWTEVENPDQKIKQKVYVCLDKSNPALDKLTDDWLAKNDPDHAEQERKNEEEMQSLFITGKPGKKDPLH